MTPRWTRINPVCAAKKLLAKCLLTERSNGWRRFKLDQEFSKYSLDVFLNNFNETRNRNGLELTQLSM